MRAFKEGKREATLMHQIAKGYSDAEIAAIAAYFARQSP
jgi:sulfide dehydrogenase cytochrome subunit